MNEQVFLLARLDEISKMCDRFAGRLDEIEKARITIIVDTDDAPEASLQVAPISIVEDPAAFQGGERQAFLQARLDEANRNLRLARRTAEDR